MNSDDSQTFLNNEIIYINNGNQEEEQRIVIHEIPQQSSVRDDNFDVFQVKCVLVIISLFNIFLYTFYLNLTSVYLDNNSSKKTPFIMFILITIVLECLGVVAVITANRILSMVYSIWVVVCLTMYSIYFGSYNPSLIINIGLYVIVAIIMLKYFQKLVNSRNVALI